MGPRKVTVEYVVEGEVYVISGIAFRSHFADPKEANFRLLVLGNPVYIPWTRIVKVEDKGSA